MTSAPFLWRQDGRPDWGSMWTTFCELALYGGPPQRGPQSALRRHGRVGRGLRRRDARRDAPRDLGDDRALHGVGRGRLAPVTCDSPTMAAWMCAAIILENVGARVDDDRLLLPAGPDYQLKDEVKSIITVVAKTHHYWQAHVADSGARARHAG